MHNLYNPAAVYSIEQKQKIIAAAIPYLTNKADYVALNASVILGMIGDPRGVEGLKRLESLSIMGVGDYAAGYLNTIRERRSNGVYGRDIVVGGVHSLLPGLDSALYKLEPALLGINCYRNIYILTHYVCHIA